MRSHRHRAVREVERGYVDTVRAPIRENRAAHGGVRLVATCKCGAERETNVNGPHVERGRWVETGEAVSQ